MPKTYTVEDRKFKVKICMKCNKRNHWGADKCRNCGYSGLRPKHKEGKK